MWRWFRESFFTLPAATWDRDQARDDALADEPSVEQIYFDSAKRELATSLMKLGIALRMHKRDAKLVLQRALVLVDEIVAAPGSNPYWKDAATKIREILAE